MKFTAALFALMAITSVAAAPAHLPVKAGAKSIASLKGGKASSKGSKSSAALSNNSAASGSNAASSNATAVASSSNSTSDSSSSNSTSSDDSSSNSTSSDSSSSDNSTAGVSGSIARARPCDQGDQSLAAGLAAMVPIGIGAQASVLTIQNTTDSADFATAVTRLNQFISTQSLQLQMTQGIADDDSFAQPQLALLATSQTAQEGLAKGLVDVKTSADQLNQLLQSFQDSTGVAQDGVNNALIDCFLPTTAVSG